MKKKNAKIFDYEYHKTESLEVRIFVKVLTVIGFVFSIALVFLVMVLLSSNTHFNKSDNMGNQSNSYNYRTSI